MEELVWQALLSSLEFSAILFDVISMEGEQFSRVSECQKIPQKAEIIIDSQPVEWSWVWGFTYCTSVLEFHDSLSCAV